MQKRSTASQVVNAAGERTQDEKTAEQHTIGTSSTAPAVPTSVIVKLLVFTLAMIAAPIGMYFGTVNLVFRGNSTWAGATAALTANAVLIGYVIVAMKEDQSERHEAEQKAKKAQ